MPCLERENVQNVPQVLNALLQLPVRFLVVHLTHQSIQLLEPRHVSPALLDINAQQLHHLR